uniref:Peptidase_S9_N domain-containing protein n=1 Tax=Haemonchus contortus TaxID=6289 RepID=A0A7I4Z2K2_HAECO|nr:endonuclease-reverse transcriptase HmRTE-e01 [Haemonchus contortus]
MTDEVFEVTNRQKYYLFSAYASQTEPRTTLWYTLDEKTAEVPLQEDIPVADDLNATIDYSCHGGFMGRHIDGERIFEYTDSHNLAIVSTKFRERDYHLVTFYSGENRSQIDFVFARRSEARNRNEDNETVATQHRPVIGTLKIVPPKSKLAERCEPTRIKWWHLKEEDAPIVYRILLPAVTTVNETWKGAAEAITRDARSENGMAKSGRERLIGKYGCG